MTLTRFRKAVFAEFGDNMQHATPANVRDFLERIQAEMHEEERERGDLKGPLVLNEHAISYEQIIKEFFSQALRLPDDQAIITLWTMAVEMSFSALESQYAEIFRPLFPEFGPE
ncbi:MAG TPA: hypothetical protein VGM37_04360 [Armatimonadota bacterium]|jgi:hypothetical protein